MKDLRQIFRETPALTDLEHDDIVALEQAMKVKNYPQGHVLIKEGKTADDIFVIIDGEVAVTSKERGGIGFRVDKKMGPGDMIGLVALVDKKKRSATCTAATPLTAAVLNWTGFTMLFNSHAKLAYGFQRLVASQLAKDSRRLNELLLGALTKLDA